ncbi:uncharacterized protein LOC135931604 [Gordionus sp. m RMFG-2023]|uniref:uncharacterized protein LOC135931604 n=1 Tax=Gordionus sp. m RMFG-2023 TaxID=3053472 RepID=UPI0031FC2AB7
MCQVYDDNQTSMCQHNWIKYYLDNLARFILDSSKMSDFNRELLSKYWPCQKAILLMFQSNFVDSHSSCLDTLFLEGLMGNCISLLQKLTRLRAANEPSAESSPDYQLLLLGEVIKAYLYLIDNVIFLEGRCNARCIKSSASVFYLNSYLLLNQYSDFLGTFKDYQSTGIIMNETLPILHSCLKCSLDIYNHVKDKQENINYSYPKRDDSKTLEPEDILKCIFNVSSHICSFLIIMSTTEEINDSILQTIDEVADKFLNPVPTDTRTLLMIDPFPFLHAMLELGSLPQNASNTLCQTLKDLSLQYLAKVCGSLNFDEACEAFNVLNRSVCSNFIKLVFYPVLGNFSNFLKRIYDDGDLKQFCHDNDMGITIEKLLNEIKNLALHEESAYEIDTSSNNDSSQKSLLYTTLNIVLRVFKSSDYPNYRRIFYHESSLLGEIDCNDDTFWEFKKYLMKSGKNNHVNDSFIESCLEFNTLYLQPSMKHKNIKKSGVSDQDHIEAINRDLKIISDMLHSPTSKDILYFDCD